MNYEWEISKEYPTKTIRQLLNLFYKKHIYLEGVRKVASQPISIVCNPVPWVLPDDPFAQDMYLVIYHGLRKFEGSRFFVIVEQNIHHVSTGPHVAKLFLQVYPAWQGHYAGKFEWLATTQLVCNFFDDRKLRAKLRRAIRLREYFASDRVLDTFITFDEGVDRHIRFRA